MLKTLYEQLQTLSGLNLKLRINDNRSTMLSVRWEQGHARVSLHRMFLKAPVNVMQELARYIKAGRSGSLPLEVKKFIEYQTQKMDYSHSVKKGELSTRGRRFDLLAIYDSLNESYFGSDLQLAITWYGHPSRRLRSQINFGLYCYPLKLIKIHRLLDSFDIPDYVVHFVVYHEMLHSVCAPFVNQRGMTIVHTPEFKQKEREFQFFHQAHQWIQLNKDRFFK
jgi:hypothetical protein